MGEWAAQGVNVGERDSEWEKLGYPREDSRLGLVFLPLPRASSH